MKAVIYTKYGSPDVLTFQEVKKPSPTDNEVLVRVMAVSVNLSDWEGLTGKPLYARFGGLFKPSRQILGSDMAGIVEAVGSAVTRFKAGDAVFGDLLYHSGCFAEYVCAPEKILALKPNGLTFVESATFPQGAVIALQGVRDKGQVQPGQKVLINGAGGGAGTFAVQLAKMYEAVVTAVDNAEKLDMLRGLGADAVIDYTREDFTRNGQRYDFILDLAAHRSVYDYKRALASNGKAYLVGGSVATFLQVLLLGASVGKAEGKTIRVLAVQPNIPDLLTMTGLCEAGKIHPVIDRTFPLHEVPDALRYHGEGHARGKIVITMDSHALIADRE
jgi:NADPH:quinone reductase-like Zn-dependent oxidoreductase